MATTSGKHGTGSIGGSPGTAIDGLTKWTVDEKGDELDATDAEANGVGQVDVGVIEPTVTVEGFHKLSSGPFPGLRVGTELTNVYLTLNKYIANSSWIFTKLVVTQINSMSEVRGQIRWSVTARNAVGGTYTGPTV
jgi:hypothetical protein